MSLWNFVLDRAKEAPHGHEHGDRAGHRDRDALFAVLSLHSPRSEQDSSCVGCGNSVTLANGSALAAVMDLDKCPTLRALAWRWHDHPAWNPRWALTPADYLSTWPPAENCYCGNSEGFAHRRGTGRRCRPNRHDRRHARRLEWQQLPAPVA